MSRVNGKRAESAFTLMELLITIAILGVIMLISLPAASKLKEANTKTQYKAYTKSFISAGKLYNDAYVEDLFGTAKDGCVEVGFSELVGKKLLKDFQADNTYCDTFCSYENEEQGTESKIRIRKNGDQYNYEAFICCIKDGKKVYETNNWKDYSSDNCQRPENNEVTLNWGHTVKVDNVDVTTDTYKITKKEQIKVAVEITSTGGCLASKNNRFTYTWYSKDNQPDPDNDVEDAEGPEESSTSTGDSDDDEDDDTVEEDEDVVIEEVDELDNGDIDSDDDDDTNSGYNQILGPITVPVKPDSTCAKSVISNIAIPDIVTKSDFDGTVVIKIEPTVIRDASGRQRIPNDEDNTLMTEISIKNIEQQSEQESGDVDPGTPVEQVLGAPTVKLSKFTGSKPTNLLGTYKNGTWYSGHVYTKASGGNASYYRHTVTGKSKNVTKKLGATRSIKANGVSYIKYCSAKSTGDKPCKKGTWTKKYTIKIDKGNPTMSIKKSNKGTTSGVTLKITCKDKVSGIVKCAGSNKKGGKEYSVTRKKIKKDYEASTKDKAGNVKKATVNVTAQKQKRTRTYGCVKYNQVCTSYTTGSCSTWQYERCDGAHCGKYTTTNYNTAHMSGTFNVSCIKYSQVCASYGQGSCAKKGYSSWSGWSNVSSCKKSNTSQCRTVYK